MRVFGPATFYDKPADWRTEEQWDDAGRVVRTGEKPVGMMSGANGSTRQHYYFSLEQTAEHPDMTDIWVFTDWHITHYRARPLGKSWVTYCAVLHRDAEHLPRKTSLYGPQVFTSAGEAVAFLRSRIANHRQEFMNYLAMLAAMGDKLADDAPEADILPYIVEG